ncbi:hypothetical protein CGLO_17065 [Colletotrichum gloeosporioides Cg-14]|uniref:Uncharacterized protein n=1 Tax=Colletotrichum gloeosporioides (strain Cg-14) TaxID=1237896 RepID=T0JXJ0_COLGC|nr:hypothetical protein CGLO_17065 [Colletotrichum gloeosporioides Cg-14]
MATSGIKYVESWSQVLRQLRYRTERGKVVEGAENRVTMAGV